MASGTSISLETLHRPSTWVQPGGRGLLAWSMVYALALCSLLVLLAGLIDLCVHRGEVAIQPGEEALARQLGGYDLILENSRVDGSGAFPTIWRLRGTLWESMGSALYRRIGALRSDQSALFFYILSIACLGWLCGYALGGVSSSSLRLAQSVSRGLREAIHRQALRLGVSDLEGREREQAWSLFTTDVDDIHDELRFQLEACWRHGLSLILLILLALFVDWKLTFMCLVPLGIAMALWDYERRREQAVRGLTDSETSVDLRLLSEGFFHPQLIKGYSMDAYEHERFEKHALRLSDRRIAGFRHAQRMRQLSRFLSIGFLSIAVYLVAHRILSSFKPDDHISLAAGLLCVFSLGAAAPAVHQIWTALSRRHNLEVTYARIRRYLSRIPEVGQAVGARFIEPMTKNIVFEGVTYAHHGRPLIEKLDLTIPAGTMTALVSPEPLTARAIAQMLPRFIEPQAGRILFDNQDIAFGTLESLRAETMYVSGRDSILTGTILENLTCGDDKLSLQEATEAAKASHAHSFIQRLPQGYETVVGERGVTLDAGESFRLALARAALRDPVVLIIEEPEAVLDEDTKALLDDAYTRICPGRTVLFLPARLSTVKRCGRVLLLRDGGVVADGRHADLIRSSEEYRHWEYTHFNVFLRKNTSSEAVQPVT